MPGSPLHLLRRIGIPAAGVVGVALVAGSVSGIARLDGTLAAQTERAAPVDHDRAVSFDPPRGHACRPPERRRPTPPPLY
jgi:hypothetical protein